MTIRIDGTRAEREIGSLTIHDLRKEKGEKGRKHFIRLPETKLSKRKSNNRFKASIYNAHTNFNVCILIFIIFSDLFKYFLYVYHAMKL